MKVFFEVYELDGEKDGEVLSIYIAI